MSERIEGDAALVQRNPMRSQSAVFALKKKKSDIKKNAEEMVVAPRSVVQRRLQKVISRKRRRFYDGKYDLDLTYITPNLIAMAQPGTGITGIWRNDLNEVSNMLKEYHGKHYLIFNLSGSRYDYSKFDHRVIDFGFPDHYVPPLVLIYEVILYLDAFLKRSYQNVAVIHCKGGKGRSGVVIACYLTYTGEFKDGNAALDFFAEKRSGIRHGVTQPSQRRYVDYFTKMCKSPSLPRTKALLFVRVNFTEDIEKCGPDMFMRVFSTSSYPKTLIYESDFVPVKSTERDSGWDLSGADIHVVGDVLCKFYFSKKKKKKGKLFRVSFHTMFVHNERLSIQAEGFDDINPEVLLRTPFTLNLEFEKMQTIRTENFEAIQVKGEDDQILSIEDLIVERSTAFKEVRKRTMASNKSLSYKFLYSIARRREERLKNLAIIVLVLCFLIEIGLRAIK